MAKTRKSEALQRPFIEPDTTTRPVRSMRSVPPQNRGTAVIMSSDDNRQYAANVLQNISGFIKMPRVASNAELMARIQDYFDYCVGRQVVPTWEALGLYCGYTRSTLFDWSTGRRKGFSDLEAGLTTADIIQKAREILAAFDATMVAAGKMPAVPYIFRGCNYYSLQNKTTVDFEPDRGSLRAPMTQEEIIKNLPDIDMTDMEGEKSHG